MAYGRLDVFWPDGKIENFPLIEDSVSVGRSVGNTIVLDTETISRYHFAFTREDDKIYLTDLDSNNGTFVDGVRLTSNEPVEVNGGEEIQVGYMRMLYFALDDDPTMQMTTVMEDTQRVETDSAGFGLELQPPPISIAPGAYTSAELTIFNHGKTTQNYAIQVFGLPDGWARVNRPLVELDGNDSTTVLTNIKPLRRSDSAPGIYNARLVVRLADKPDAMLEVPFKVTILAYGGLGMALAARRFGTNDLFQLHLHNQGSAPLPLQITGRDPAQQMQFMLRPSQLTLAPGQRVQIACQVKPAQRRLFGGMQEYPFDLVAQSLDAARFTAAVPGYIVDKPPMPFWASFAMIGGLLLAVLLVVIGGLALLSRTPDPVIDHFSVDNGSLQIAQGDPLRLSWDVRNATFITVRLNDHDALTSQLAALTAGTELDTSEISGNINVTLLAYTADGSKSVSSSQQIVVYLPLKIETFTAAPQPVVRHVVQNLTLTYNVPGATQISFSGLEQVTLSQAPLPMPPGNQDSISVPVLPESDFAVTLIAVDASGTIARQTLNIALVDPTCQPAANASLYAAPDAASNVIGTIAARANLIVNGRDPSGQWLRTVAPQTNLEVWANRADFTCANTFKIEDLRMVGGNPAQTQPSPTLATTPSAIAPPLTVVPAGTATSSVSVPTTPTLLPSPTVNTSGN